MFHVNTFWCRYFFVNANEKENQHADDDASEDEGADKEENYEHLEIVEEITILPPKEKKKKDKKESKEQKKVEKLLDSRKKYSRYTTPRGDLVKRSIKKD